VVGVAANADGNLLTAKKWENDMVRACEQDVTGLSDVSTDWIDVSDAAAVSLRFANTSDKSFTVIFFSDQYTNSNYRLYDYNGGPVAYRVAKASSRTQILTPDDAPVLQWLRAIKMRIEFEGTPTTGSLIIDIVKKR
jgi:hypothetical protein